MHFFTVSCICKYFQQSQVLYCYFTTRIRYGEVVNINLIREKDTGKSKGFCFLCYEDQRSTVLAVDNFNGIKILNRTIRVDHVSDYKVPKEGKKTDAETKKLYQEGCAPKAASVPPEPVKPEIPPPPAEDLRYTLADQIVDGVRLPPRLPIDIVKIEKMSDEEQETKEKVEVSKVKKEKKKRKHKKKSKKRKKKESSSDADSESIESSEDEKKHKKREKRKSEDKKSRDEEKRCKK